ncbi:AAA family ATPase [Chitinophaga ginsengisegetis]|uniref:AAA family ATPase n=1 Tax=Chitinophaga ginsengisegetis TaxID=393003 RepID=UPI000DBA0D33|nr:AAA family ATPase [Chitinophaga ginsengisegetis]MDR6571035.1 energy-coupling factor transporter ATP-binding protein EcfA2 [Chitinophaga ginsengisegetis]MDR6650769.1 energy-coupling factor transporter ATP-binding protein EcfA2 [Chitinophaga ginsengisegetis]MDR6657119.1 energy-coupling factor transporter ATP-binding protein EcfA2 [Chitinophaga ginsengisegetis]
MQRISKITLNNFKFFYGQVPMNFNRKNVIIYGENGSGKSSIYWSLYTFLQSVFKENAEIRKYFEPKHPENLINKYSTEPSNSSIIVELEDDANAKTTKEISLSQINTKTDQLIRELTLGSDFINHHTLSRIYAYYHKDEINLFNIFEYELLAFIAFKNPLVKQGETTSNVNAEVWWDYVRTAIPKINDKDIIEAYLKEFNENFDTYLKDITELTNTYITERFKEKFNIFFEYRPATYPLPTDGEALVLDLKVKEPEIIMTVKMITDKIAEEEKKIIDSPQSFLNEARLSTIALALRLAILDEKYVEAYPKVLILDDMLMSMDMSNREFLLNLILDNYQDKYQIIFMTHQRGLFEDAKKTIQQHYIRKSKDSGETNTEIQIIEWNKYWEAIEMYEGENENGIPIPKILPSGSSLQKAIYYFKENIDYSACGNNLRGALEEFFREFIPKNHFRDDKGNPIDEKNLMLHELLQQAKKYFTFVGFDIKPLDKLDRYREQSLNRASHYNPKTEFYKKELNEIFGLIELLKKNKIIPIVKADKQLQWEIKTSEGKTYSYEATLLDNINVYNKNDGNPNYFVPADKITLVYTQCLFDGAPQNAGQRHPGTLTSVYRDLITYINKSGEAIVEADVLKVFKDLSGATLESLK